MKKKQLSRIVTERMLAAITGTFTALMVIILIFLISYEKRSVESLLRFGLENVEKDATYREERNHRLYRMPSESEEYDAIIKENGTGYLNSPELAEYLIFRKGTGTYSERNIVSPEGVIMASSEPRNVGFDLHSDPRLSEFLCLLDGSTDFYFQNLGTSPINGTQMIYFGARMPQYGGFILNGQNREDYGRERESDLASSNIYGKIGRTGYFLLINKDNKIVCSPGGIHNGEILTLSGRTDKAARSGKIIKEDVFGVPSYVRVLPDTDDYIVATYPLSEAWAPLIAEILVLLTVYAVVFTILFILINRLITRHVIRGVVSLDNSLSKITDGDLEEKADFRDSLEFDELSDGINYMVDRMKGLIKDAEERINAELALAASIQTSFLPREFPDRDEFGLFASMIPAKEVGGDFYDFFFIDRDHLALVIGDVSGKGIPAALFMVMVKDKLRHSVLKYGTDVAAAAREVNAQLCRENDAMFFVTVWLGVFTVSTGHTDYVDAGHNYPAIYRSGEKFTLEDDVHCLPLAALEEAVFEAGSFELFPGDILFLYTDGVTEANDPGGKLFGENRMLEALNEDASLPPEAIDAAVRASVAEFSGDAPQYDDTTTLVFRYRSV
ncbi:MAG: SpoIIE family protein phosphatase [Lachnospiraceae bacterium]|nr:SpoIIE family protein phosphatase [Lachnospiraceae bacterium]